MGRGSLRPRPQTAAARPSRGAAPRPFPDLDRVIHERIRLGIVSALAADSPLTFSELKKLLDTTDGNLSVHARKLEDAGYVSCTKSFVGRVPKSAYRLTPEGKRALEKYLNHLEALIHSTRKS